MAIGAGFHKDPDDAPGLAHLLGYLSSFIFKIPVFIYIYLILTIDLY